MKQRIVKVTQWLKNIIQYEDLSYGGSKTLNDVIKEVKTIHSNSLEARLEELEKMEYEWCLNNYEIADKYEFEFGKRPIISGKTNLIYVKSPLEAVNKAITEIKGAEE